MNCCSREGRIGKTDLTDMSRGEAAIGVVSEVQPGPVPSDKLGLHSEAPQAHNGQV